MIVAVRDEQSLVFLVEHRAGNRDKKAAERSTVNEQPKFDDVPGTYVFTKEYARKGYHLNMFCMSLNVEANRDEFRSDEAAYLRKHPMTDEQRQAVLDRNWLEMLRLGGNIYYTFKIVRHDRRSMQYVGAAMSGVTEDEFKQIMLTGGKDQEGNPRGGPNVLESRDD